MDNGGVLNNPFLPHFEEDRREILDFLSLSSSKELFKDIPESVRLEKPMNLPPSMSEYEVKKHIEAIAAQNKSMKDCISFLGGGVYDHFIPSAVNHIIGRSEFYTSYTPYQAEISQGILQSMFEYQSMIAELTGMDLSNASIYDGATAAAEGAIRAVANTKNEEILVSGALPPNYREVLRTYLEGQGLTLKTIPISEGVTDIDALSEMISENTACVILQNPNFFGIIEDYGKLKEVIKDYKALFVAVTDPISLALIKPPSEWGADIVVGDGQSLGNPTSFGGPLLGFFAADKKFLRRMPGRMVGEAKDSEGKTGYVLTLQTREQHIRREKATSNICSNQALNVLAACVYLSLMGPNGLREVAYQSLQKAQYTKNELEKLNGVSFVFEGKPFFKEFVIKLSRPVEECQRELLEKNIFPGIDLSQYYEGFENCMLVSITEKRTKEEIDYLAKAMREVL